MSESLGAVLPDALRERLEGREAGPWADLAVPIASVDRLGRPHPALLSYDELAAPDAATLRLALYDGSRSSDNLRLRGALTLFLVAPGAVHYVKAQAREVEGGLPDHPGLALFEAQVEEVLFDRVDPSLEGAAEIETGIRVRRARPAAGLRAALLGR
jgi:hypothetical protein